MTILVTGAHGTLGAGLLLHLTDAGVDVRAASALPRQHEARLDLHNQATFAPALKGAAQVFLYANPDTAASFAAAAADAGVEHLVLLSSNAVTSVTTPDTDPLAAPFRVTENALTAGSVPVTVLRPGSFHGNARQWIHGIRADRAVALPYPLAQVDAVDERDIAEVAYRSLTRPELRGEVLNLTGPAAISLTEQVRALAAALGEEISLNPITREQWKRSTGGYITDDNADALLDYWKSRTDRPAPVTTTVRDITGHPAISFRRWAEDNIGPYRLRL